MAKLDTGKIIEGSFRMLVENKAILTVAIIGAIVSAVFGFLLISSVFLLSVPLIIVLGIAWILVSIYLSGVAIAAASGKMDLNDALAKAGSRYLPLLGTTILSIIIIILGFIALIIPGIYIMIRLALASPATVLENRSPVDSLKRSWAITAGNWWSIFWILFAIGIVVAIIRIIFSIPSPVLGYLVEGFLAYVSVIASVLILQRLRGSIPDRSAPKKPRNSKQ